MGVLDRIFKRDLPVPPEQRTGVGPSVGRTGLKIWNGYIDEEWVPELANDRQFETYRRMMQDPVINAVLTTVRYLVRKTDWFIEPGEDSNAGREDAEFVERELGSMRDTWENHVSEILSMLPWGYSWHEQVLRRNPDGTIGWDGFPIRAQESRLRWDWNDDRGEVRAFIQSAPPDYREVPIPLRKSLHFRTEAHKGNPEGRSLLRGVYEAWYYKSHLQRLEGITHERNGAGIPVVRIPANIILNDATTYEKYKKLAANLRTDEQQGIVIPSDRDEHGNYVYEVELMSAAGASEKAHAIGESIVRYDQRIAQGMLADVILLGHEKVGSFALADSKTNLMGVALGVFLDVIAAEFNTRAIPRLMGLNNRATLPVLRHGDVETVDLKELGAFITAAANAGASLFPDPKFEVWVRHQMGAPEMTEEEIEQLQDEKAQREQEMFERQQASFTAGKEERAADRQRRGETTDDMEDAA